MKTRNLLDVQYAEDLFQDIWMMDLPVKSIDFVQMEQEMLVQCYMVHVVE